MITFSGSASAAGGSIAFLCGILSILIVLYDKKILKFLDKMVQKTNKPAPRGTGKDKKWKDNEKIQEKSRHNGRYNSVPSPTNSMAKKITPKKHGRYE